MTVQIFVISKTQSIKLIGVLRPKKPTKCQRRKDKKQQNHPLSDTNEREERRTKLDMKQTILKKRTIEQYTSNCQQ